MAALLTCRGGRLLGVSWLVAGVALIFVPWSDANPGPRPKEPISASNRTELSHEARLVHHLLDRYKTFGKVARPLYNSRDKIIVRFGLRLIQVDLIEKEQAMKASVWVRCRWIDQYLQWDPSRFGGLRGITLPWDSVWLPDIVLVNTADAEVDERPADLMVEFDGRVYWSPHKVYKSACLVDVTNFPYDKHTCSMWFQSMSRYSWHMDVWPSLSSPWDLDTYLGSFKESQEWAIEDNVTQRFEKSRDIGVLLKFSRRTSLRFSLTLSRRLGYTCHLLMMPCIFLVSMTLVVFCLPPERPDRHSLAMSLFGSFMVLLLILVEVAPPTAASVPKLGIYYACNMSLVMLSIFLSGTVINISRRGDTRLPVPHWVRLVFIDVLSRPLLLHERVSAAFGPRPNTSTGHKQPKSEREDTPLSPPNGNETKPNRYTFPTFPADPFSSTSSSSAPPSGECIVHLDEKLRKVESLVTKMADSEDPEKDRDFRRLRVQWRNVSVVMDRMFFVIYLVVILVTCFILFPRPM